MITAGVTYTAQEWDEFPGPLQDGILLVKRWANEIELERVKQPAHA